MLPAIELRRKDQTIPGSPIQLLLCRKRMKHAPLALRRAPYEPSGPGAYIGDVDRPGLASAARTIPAATAGLPHKGDLPAVR